MPWKKMRLRDATVWVRTDAAGAPLAERGRVEIRYNPTSPKAYHAASANLSPIAGVSVFPDEHCVPAAPAEPGTSRAKAPSRAKSAYAEATELRPALPPDAVIVYADGACSGNPGPAGLGVVVIEGPVRTELSEYLGHATNNVAELTAVGRSLDLVEDPKRVIAIHTDSKYAIGVLSEGWKAKANQELIAELREQLRAFRDRVQFIHVRGHAGVVLNERADELARNAITNRRTERQVFRSARTPAER
jgi:ribonuclease HI